MESTSKSVVNNDYSRSCFCCLQNDCFGDVSSGNNTSGQKEVFKDMIKDTFNIQIYQDNSTSPGIGSFICDQCVSRLRDASAFRQMVVDSQVVIREHYEKLKSYEDENIRAASVLVDASDIKVETLPVVDEFEDGTVVNDGFDDNDEILADLKMEVARTGTQRMKKDLGRRSTKLKKCKIKDESRDTAQSDSSRKDWRKILERRGNGPILRDNSLKLLANSTGCVFQWNKSRYRCFCCKEPFSDLTSLRDHTSKHTLEQIERKIISQQNRLVKVDISILNCKLCSERIDNLTDLKNHLIHKHNTEFVSKEDLLVPFKISGDLQCQLCSEEFSVFRHLNIHMNKHYQKHVCHICGAGFSNSVFLNLHKTRTHSPFSCKICNLEFGSRSVKRKHDAELHGAKSERKLRFPCPYCDERFLQENFRVEHLVERHGMAKPEFKCVMCPKVYITKSLCNNHVKTVHMKEKKQECEVCHKLFYNKSDVVRHSVTHTGEKQFSCAACETAFATRDSLRRHLRRTHAGIQAVP